MAPLPMSCWKKEVRDSYSSKLSEPGYLSPRLMCTMSLGSGTWELYHRGCLNNNKTYKS